MLIFKVNFTCEYVCMYVYKHTVKTHTFDGLCSCHLWPPWTNGSDLSVKKELIPPMKASRSLSN